MSDLKENPNELMDINWVAERVGLSVVTIKRYIKDEESTFPKGMKLSPGKAGPRRWRRQIIEDWIIHAGNAAA